MKQARKHKYEKEREKEIKRQQQRSEEKENLENSGIQSVKRGNFLNRVNTKIMSTIKNKLSAGNMEYENSFFTKKKSGELNISNNESRDNKIGAVRERITARVIGVKRVFEEE